MDLVDDRFVLEKLLGRGAFGEAHVARDRDGTRVVLKLLHAEHAAREDVRERFRREVVALERLRHPNVVVLVAHGTCAARGQPGQPYYAMEFSPGESLDRVLLREGRLPLVRALALVDQLLAALEAAHALGIVHRDLKPANLLLESRETGELLRVIDFGLAKHTKGGAQTAADLTGKGLLGSPAFMAPEQCRGLAATPKADIYATGCILVNLVTSRILFEAKGVLELLRHHAETRAPRLDTFLPDAPAALVALVDRCLEKRPEDRPDAVTLRAELARIASEHGVGSRATATVIEDGADADATLAPPVRWIPETLARPPSEGALGTGAVRRDEPSSDPPPPPRAVTAPAATGASRDPKPGERLGGYLLERTLGEGGFGRVFLTTLADGRKAALKVLLATDANDPIESDKRFQREARLLKTLDHPAFPRVFDFGLEGPLHYAVLEFIDGEDLAQTIEREHRLSLERVLPVLRQILPGLDFAHARGVVHCDLKPANVRVRRDGRAFLLDLGIAKIREGSALGGRSIQTQAGIAFGTLEYLAPELAHGRDAAAPAADIYSLGVMLFECLAGRLPFLEREPLALVAAHERCAPPDLAGLAPGIPIAVCDLVRRCMAKKPSQRPATAGDVLRELETVMAPAPPEVAESRPSVRRVSVLIPRGKPAPTVDEAPPAVAGEPAIPPTRISPSVAPIPKKADPASPSAPFGPPRAPIPPTRVSPSTAASEAATLGPDYRLEEPLPSAVLVPPPKRTPAAPVPRPQAAPAPTRVVSVPDSFAPSSMPMPPPSEAPVVSPEPKTTLSDFGPDALAVCVLSGKSAGLVQVVEGLRGELAIGRDPDAFLVVAAGEDQLSRRHAAIVVHADGVSIRELAGKVLVEGKPAGTGGLPLARGAVVRLGEPGVLLVLETLACLTEKKGPTGSALKRVDRHAPMASLEGPVLLGRASDAAIPLHADRDVLASSRHAQITPRGGLLVLEDLGSANGTFVNGKRVHVAVLKHEDEIALGGPEGPRFLAEIPPEPSRSVVETLPPAHSRSRTAKLGVSREPLPDSGDALRGKLEVEFEGQKGVLFLFAGTRLRFGRNANRGTIENDLVLRAFPGAKNEDPKLVQARTRDLSGHHGAFVVTRDGVAVRDDGSKLGTELDGVALAKHELVPLKEQFVLEIAKVVALRGRIIRAADAATGDRVPGVEASHPVEALRLERTRDGEHMSYVLLVREAMIGSGEDDAVFLPHLEVKPAHARLAVRRGKFAIGPSRPEAAVSVARRALAASELVDLEPGVEIRIGKARLRYSPAQDDDMKPPE
jgi:serine/threonine protein kinase/pSer/pThr/pTyr-binding forkhead associated (FHA) protein